MRFLAPLLVVVVVAGLALVPSAGARKPRVVYVDVTYEGSGTMERHQVQKGAVADCTIEQDADDSSTFTWKVTWRNVKIELHGKTAPFTRTEALSQHPKGYLKGRYTSATKNKNSCFPDQNRECAPASTSFFGPARDATLFIYRRKGDLAFMVDAQTGVTGGHRCPDDVEFGPQAGGFYWDDYNGADPPTPLNLGALSAVDDLPSDLARDFGKIITHVRRREFNSPTPNQSCGPKGVPDINCHVTQDWKGTITLRRRSAR